MMAQKECKERDAPDCDRCVKGLNGTTRGVGNHHYEDIGLFKAVVRLHPSHKMFHLPQPRDTSEARLYCICIHMVVITLLLYPHHDWYTLVAVVSY
jgi:hypothetical protein